MEKTIKVNESSTLYRKIEALQLSSRDRAKALAALETGDRIADAIYWMFEKIERISGWITPNPKLKHQ